MIDTIDAQLREILNDATGSRTVQVTFDPPTNANVSDPVMPIVNAYLYDVREDSSRRAAGRIPVNGTPPEKWPTGKPYTTATHAPSRYLRLSYMITTWARDIPTAHRLLSAAYCRLALTRTLPLTTAGLPYPNAELEVGRPPIEDGLLSELWSTFGSPLSPLLNVTITTPMSTFEHDQITAARVTPDGVNTSTTPTANAQATANTKRRSDNSQVSS
ncbi:hypothetical protein C9F11_43780 (plasmid) [Streptomyces sp. YIM 121038]|uniref:Pvc16 family protein n=1 Tax=Streptomyces sp. YIM 121038 TaxID=2136401 RepID=UPI001110BC9B|nr:Pvc16 family protein [Streptomyces sp. YIM 121038]QCX82334.1 hypothetical protein C9F11_43780 [Streptomyces sp. YIM 121038]